jgi:hypothetical protein
MLLGYETASYILYYIGGNEVPCPRMKLHDYLAKNKEVRRDGQEWLL